MRRRLALLAVVAALAGTLALLSPTPPAQAVPHDACAGIGLATLSSPFFTPTQPAGGIHPHSATFRFHFNSWPCLVSSAGALSATGTIHGWCGLSSGGGVSSLGDRFNFVGIGEVVVFTGGLAGVMMLVPATNTGCSGESVFLAAGAVVRTSCDVVESKPIVSVDIPDTSTSVAGVHLSTSGHLPLSVQVCV